MFWQEWISHKGRLRAFAPQTGRLRLVPDLLEDLRLNAEEAIARKHFTILDEILDGVEEVAIVHRVLHISVNVQQVLPNVAPQRPLVIVQHARRLRNQLQVDVVLLYHVLVLDLRLRQFGAHLRCL